MNNNTPMIDAEQLLNKWKPVLDFHDDTVAPITESHKRYATAQLLENQAKWLAEANVAQNGGVFGSNLANTFNGGFSGDNYAPGDARLPKIVIPMVRRTFPELITNEIVGVQPMSGPVGLAFALRYKYLGDPLDQNYVNGAPNARPTGWPKNSGTGPTNQEQEAWWHDGVFPGEANSPSGTEAGYNYLDTRYTGASTSAFGHAVDVLSAQLASGSATSGYNSMVSGIFSKSDTGIARLMSEFEMTGKIPQMTIGIEKASVEAGTRRIAAHWSVELEQDLKAMNGIDIDQEMTQSLSYEIQAEIDREMLTRMIHICVKAGYAKTSKGKGISFWDAGTADGRWLGERCRDFYAHVIVEANRMAVYNRRGPANFIVATPRVCALLEMLPEFKAFPVGSSVNTAQTGVAKVGQVGGRFTVYRDTRTEAQYDMGERDDPLEYALLGFKGSEYYDTGIVFCPYIPVMMQRALDPNTFTPKVGLMTRYGVVDHIFGADMFYHLILVTGMGTEIASLTEAKRVFL